MTQSAVRLRPDQRAAQNAHFEGGVDDQFEIFQIFDASPFAATAAARRQSTTGPQRALRVAGP